ncbi:hypothetical protein TNCV_2821221 [Trichonephila clavipes]|nr:hypothetical protein TNCV_2821221 [Trichonephila clavipes]
MFGIPSKKTQNIDTDTLHKLALQEITLTITSFILRFLVPEAWSSNEGKSRLLRRQSRRVVHRKQNPYDDDHIDKVDRSIRRFLNNYSFSIPPLTSSRNLRHHLQIKHTQSPRSRPNQNIALKSLPNERNNPSTKIFNKCLLLQHFPQIWKHCTISLLPKKTKTRNFR